MKKVAVLGSTGSIGRQTLDVIASQCDSLEVSALVAYSDAETLAKQKIKYGAGYAALIAEKGADCLIDAVKGADTVVVATRGIIALDAVLFALKEGKTVALANKETLVCGGELVRSRLAGACGRLVTLDSEHSAIWQCLAGKDSAAVKRLILTASGGAFLNYTEEQLKTAKAREALKHPTWSMGNKITIDSATMMNKGLEIIEASYLFDVPQEKIDVLVHPQSVVHSLVEFVDGSVMAQMACPDMRLPIQYALTYPERLPSRVKPLDLVGARLEFYAPDCNKFKCISLCRQAFAMGGLYPTVLNAANDVCVDAYLKNKIGFFDIAEIIEKVLNCFSPRGEVSAETIKKTDAEVKKFTASLTAEI